MTLTELDAAIEAARAQRQEATRRWGKGEGEALAVVQALAQEERLREQRAEAMRGNQ